MSISSPKLPAGYRLVRLETTDSTNAEAMRRANAGEPGPLWVWSARQSSGRGRQGREWHSQAGNLFASLLIGVACPLRTASQLALVAGVVAYDAKVAGMLLESSERKVSNRTIVVIGTGINIAHHPEGLTVPATSLAVHNITVTTAEALEALAELTDYWLGRWDNGAMFGVIRRAWLDRAGPTGRPLRVRIKDEPETEGVFAGLDSEGALRLLMSDGAERRVAAGDVFFGTR